MRGAAPSVTAKASSFRQVGPDPTVYGFVAHAEVAMALEVPADLLRAVLLGQQALQRTGIARSYAATPSGSANAAHWSGAVPW
jgi:hypothetical protein